MIRLFDPMKKNLQELLKKAKKALKEKKGLFDLNCKEIVDEFMQLNIEDSKEIWPLLTNLIDEIKPEHLIGDEDTEFTFAFRSARLGKEVRLKFSLKNGYFVYRSLLTFDPPK